jgi:uncharacterized membrane protein YfcA
MLDAFSEAQLAWAAGVVFGAYVVRGMSGFGAGLVATPLLAFLFPMSTVVPTTALIVFVLFVYVEMIARIGGYTLAGYYTPGTLLLVAVMLPFMLLGTWLGEKINARITAETFTRILAVMLLLSGASLLIK